ncbi:uncharacterized protein [Musca autumnalis]|uniref:uncharacterized protein n=1 Tax=Musca autumnalis TaxID=221902 RepID=UPI003CF1CF19
MTFYTTLNREQRYNLIELVKERPVLYDKRHRLFRSVKEKEYRWKEISQLLNKSEVACKKAWKTIRDQYNRYMRMPERKRKRYRYLNQLSSFLGSVPRKSQSGQKLMDSFSDLSDYSDDFEDQRGFRIINKKTEFLSNKAEDSSEHENDIMSQFSEIDEYIHAENAKTTETTVSLQLLNAFNVILKKKYELEEDDNDIFFRMLAKKMKILPPDVKHRLQESFLEQINQETSYSQ